MKLRRALVTAAATAAIAPIALLSAPAAFAGETPGTTGETVETAPPASPATSSETPSTGTTETGSPETGTKSPSPSDTQTPPASSSPTTKAPSPSDSETATTSPEPSDSDEPGDECSDYEDSPGTLAELRGLPSKIVAGSGWHGFTFRVSNMTDTAFESVSADLYAFAFAYDEDTTEITKYLRVQYSDGSGWHDVDTSVSAQDALSFGDAGAIAPGKHADVKLRLKVDAKAPTGIGGSVAFATSVNADGVCGFSVPEDQEYRFEILAAGTKPGTVPTATGSPRPSNTPAPQASSTPLAGSLAETGSSSMLPTLGLVGGVAVLAGAGVVYSVRRRKVSNEA